MLCRKHVPYTFLGLLAFLVVAALSAPSPSRADGQVKNIMVIGWDGAGRTGVRELLAKGELSNVAALIREGRFLDIDVVSGATDTKAGWTQLLTGYVPEKTGVYNNGRYEPIPDGYTLFERLERFFGPDNIDTVAVIGKRFHIDADPPYRGTLEAWTKSNAKRLREEKETYPDIGTRAVAAVLREGGRIVEKEGQRIVEIPGKPWYHASKHLDLWVNGLEENEKVARRTVAELERCKDRRFFFFVHFAQPDHRGHKFGEGSPEYTEGFRLDDRYSGEIIQKLKDLGLYQKTLVYIVADHGFDKGKKSHLYAPFVFAATNDPKVVRNQGTREDIAATVLKRFGVDLSKLEPKLDGVPLDEKAPSRRADPKLTKRFRHQYNYIDNRENNAKKRIQFD